jgi:hypothetical protein
MPVGPFQFYGRGAIEMPLPAPAMAVARGPDWTDVFSSLANDTKIY